MSPSPRRAVLDLAPLELDCMNTLWPLGEATVRELRDRLAERRNRAYTTIMTIMDRLARKGVVERRKSGRAYVYRANLSAEQARTQALAQVIENFFAGSKAALLAQLNGAVSACPEPAAGGNRVLPSVARVDPSAAPERPRARAVAAAAAASPPSPASGPTSAPPARAVSSDSEPKDRIDATLL